MKQDCPIALAYEAKCEAIYKRFKVDELDDAAQIPSAKLGPLAARIASLPSRDRSDLLAKARICEIDPDMVEVSEDIGLSIAKDFAQLAAASPSNLLIRNRLRSVTAACR